jgi:hypothetical protein
VCGDRMISSLLIISWTTESRAPGMARNICGELEGEALEEEGGKGDLGDIWMAQQGEDRHQWRLLELIVLFSNDGEEGVDDASLHEVHLVGVGAVQHTDALRAEIPCAPRGSPQQGSDLIDVRGDEALLAGGVLVVKLEHHLDHCELRLDGSCLQFATHTGQDLVRVRSGGEREGR